MSIKRNPENAKRAKLFLKAYRDKKSREGMRKKINIRNDDDEFDLWKGAIL